MVSKLLEFKFKVKDDTAASFKKLNTNLSGIGARLGGIRTGIAGAFGAAGFGLMAKKAVDTADKIHKLNLRLGASPEALSQLAYAAERSGVPVNTMTMAMQRMVRRISEAADGSGEAQGALEELGLEAGELNQLKPAEQLNVIADAMDGLAGDAEQVRIAMRLFDSEGVQMVQMLKGGSVELMKLRQNADDLGLTLDEVDVGAAASFKDSMTDIKSVMQAITTEITIGLAPSLTKVANTFVDWYKINRDLISQNAAAVFERLKITLSTVWPYAKQLAEWLYKVVDASAKAAAAVAVFLERRTMSDEHRNQIIDNAWSGGGQAAASQPAPGTAAYVAAQGGGSGFTGQDAADFAFGTGGGGATIVNNFNGQMSRSDYAAVTNEQTRMQSRQ